MTILDPALLAQIRLLPCCWQPCRQPAEAHHLWTKGFGGGSQLDVRWNLAALCREHHQAHHDGHRPLHCDLLVLVAAREHSRQDWIEQAIHVLQRIPNRAARWQIERACMGVPRGVMKLVAPVLAREAA